MPVDWRVDGGLTHCASRLANSSAHGVFVSTSLPQPVGTPIELQFDMGSGGTLQIKGRVRWVEPQHGMGIGLDDDPRCR
jgi:hypothetical protein